VRTLSGGCWFLQTRCLSWPRTNSNELSQLIFHELVTIHTAKLRVVWCKRWDHFYFLNINICRLTSMSSDIQYLSILTAIFQVNLGLLLFIAAKDDGGGGDNWSYKTCKAPVKSSPLTNQHPTFVEAGCHSCRPTNSIKALVKFCIFAELVNWIHYLAKEVMFSSALVFFC